MRQLAHLFNKKNSSKKYGNYSYYSTQMLCDTSWLMIEWQTLWLPTLFWLFKDRCHICLFWGRLRTNRYARKWETYFLLARAKTWMSFSHYLLSGIHCPLTFHILIIFSCTTWPNWIKVVILKIFFIRTTGWNETKFDPISYWMASFKKCVFWPCKSSKIAAKADYARFFLPALLIF